MHYFKEKHNKMTLDNVEIAVDGDRILLSLHIVYICKPDISHVMYLLIYSCLYTIGNYDSAVVDSHHYQLKGYSYSVWSVTNFLLRLPLQP